MVCLPKQLQAFSALANYFECAAKSGRMSSAIDYMDSWLAEVADRISDRAIAQGKTDTDTTGVACVFGGEATAIGEDSKATGMMKGTIADMGLVTYAIGTCTFSATAKATGDNTAVAFTDSFAQVSGADFVLIINVDYSTPLVAGADFSFSTSSSSFIAIDLEYWDSARGPIYIEYDRTLCRYVVNANLDDSETAVLDSVLESFGENSFAQLDAGVLTVEDTLSTVTAVATLAVA
jgi:hypothetical protein